MGKDLAALVVDIARRVVASGAISANGHGNVSIRVPGADEMYLRPARPCAITRHRSSCGPGSVARPISPRSFGQRRYSAR
jgi:hypothetical protein